MIKKMKEQLNQINKELDELGDKYSEIMNLRKKQGLSLAIYSCTDRLAIKMRELDQQIMKKEEDFFNLRKEIKKLEFEKYSEKCIIEQKPFEDNKYKLIVNNSNEPIYLKSKEEVEKYVSKCTNNKENIIVYEYIDFNNDIPKEKNLPILIKILELDFEKDYRLIQVAHQKNYSPYLREISTISTNEIMNKIEIGYDKKNEEIFSHSINVFQDERICIHNPFSSKDYITIEKFKKTNKYFVKNGEHTNYKMKIFDVLPKKYQDLVDKTIKYLENCKDYSYDIKYLQDVLNNN